MKARLKGQFGVGNLQLDATAGNDRPVLAPVELERFPGLEAQGHKNTPDPLSGVPGAVRVSTAG
jgi:hypothetical protein